MSQCIQCGKDIGSLPGHICIWPYAKYGELQVRLYEADNLIDDLIEGHEGTQGPEFWESPLGKKAQAWLKGRKNE